MGKKILWTLLALTLLAGAGAGGYWVWRGATVPEPKTPAEWLERALALEQSAEKEIAAANFTGGLPKERREALEKEVSDAFWKVLEVAPDSPEAAQAEWRAIERSRNNGNLQGRDLVEVWDEFAAKRPESEEALKVRLEAAAVLSKLGEHDEALKRWREFARERPQDERSPEALYEALKLLQKLKRFEEAEVAATELIERYPEHPRAIDARYQRAVVRMDELKKVEEALIDFRDVAKESPESPRGRVAQARRRQVGGERAEKKRQEVQQEYYGAEEVSFSSKIQAKVEDIEALEAQPVGIVDYKLRARLSVNDQRLYARVAMGVEVDSDAEKPIENKLMIRLNQYLTVESVERGGLPVKYTRRGDILEIELDEPLPSGWRGEFHFQYWGNVLEMAVIHERGVFLTHMANWHPGFYWLAPHPSDVSLVVPKGYTAVGPGLLQGVEEITEEPWGESSVYRWLQEEPIMSIPVAASRYVHRERQIRPNLLLQCYAYSQDEEDIDLYLDDLERIIAFYEEILTPFPYDKLAVAQVPFFFGGYGPATLLMIKDDVFAKGAAGLEKLLAHETAHQWFGNLVISRYQGLSHPWLSEGFATYLDALYMERRQGAEIFRERARDMGTLYFEALYAYDDVSIFDVPQDNPLYHTLVYEKGALVLHALRFVMGDAAFFAGLKDYAGRFSFQEVEIFDFQEVMEEYHEESLGWFFDQWLFGKGYPRYRLEKADALPAETGDLWTVELSVAQMVAEDAQPFQGPLEARVYGADGQETSTRVIFGPDETQAGASVAVPFRPLRVEIDPDAWILKFPARDELIMEFKE
jgi:aminopeptidase N